MTNTHTLPQLQLSFTEDGDGESIGLHPFIRIKQSPTTYTGATIIWGMDENDGTFNARLEDYGNNPEHIDVYGADAVELENNIIAAFKDLHDNCEIVNNYDTPVREVA